MEPEAEDVLAVREHEDENRCNSTKKLPYADDDDDHHLIVIVKRKFSTKFSGP